MLMVKHGSRHIKCQDFTVYVTGEECHVMIYDVNIQRKR